MAKRGRQAQTDQPAFPKNPLAAKRPTRHADPKHNARGFTVAEWKAAGYDPEQFETARPVTDHAPASAIVADLIEQLRGEPGADLAARIVTHALAPARPKVPPTAAQLGHALTYGKESLWYDAAEAVARELAIEGELESADVRTSAESPEHLARCATCGFSIRFRPSSSGTSFTLLTDAINLGIGLNGRPICREDGHGEMGLADEQLVPASEAIGQVAERVNGDRPTQAELFELAKPFNFEGAWLELEAKQAEIDVLAREHEDAASEAKSAKKALDDARETLGRMIHTWQSRRLQKTRDQAEQADRIAEQEAQGAAHEPADETIDNEAGETSDDEAIATEAGSGAAAEAVQ